MACDPISSTAAHEAEWWSSWRALDFSWQGLAARPGHGEASLQDYWRNEGDRLIAEPGTARLWTRFHCPFAFADGSPSPKASWTEADWRDLHQGLRTRLAKGTAEQPCRFDGIVIDALREAEDEVPDAAGFLWLRAPNIFVRSDVDLRHAGLALCDVAGAWLGGRVDMTGAEILSGSLNDVVMARTLAAVALPERIQASPAAASPTVIETPVETIAGQETNERPKSRRGLWIIVGMTVVAISAGAAWLLHAL